MKCNDCGREFSEEDYPEDERYILDGMTAYGVEICYDCLQKRVRKANENYEEIRKIASEEYEKLKECSICGKKLWITKSGIKFCKDCELFYTPLELVENEIEEKICSLLPDYENACEDLCPIGETECPITSRNWIREDYSIHNLPKEEIETAKPLE